ncbi:hypothetical protein TraAM80_05390 [Trypanosoma rangeli]|uniref:Uncharacterized protein n=1 Tax=Trypanosoma rangeli TaxID=5698 RepID=A0A3R7MKQ3_TRYRA|nr:uncharacterized protein TraAM80_05390 [Trypanosoma rangeli]RNF04254.1 hypothetical protein TraAM80_05390 [Trypanosoma rangeli]|eukprot:RNF04254.1 hypothetical protein TraAM80_05390 [Trypanosoma rangeli]
MQSLQLVRFALQMFRRKQRARLVDLYGERAEREEALLSVRAAYEARVSARRFRTLQQEAREGLVAEESLVRGTVEGNEVDARCVVGEQAAQALLLTRAEEAARSAEQTRMAAAACLPKSPSQQQQQQRKRGYCCEEEL